MTFGSVNEGGTKARRWAMGNETRKRHAATTFRAGAARASRADSICKWAEGR
jgi:hypothetical protein